LPVLQDAKVVVKTRHLIDLRQAHAHDLGQGDQMGLVQSPVGVMQGMQMLDQQVTRVPIHGRFAQNGVHHRQGLGIGHSALDLLARTAGAVAQMFWGT
jgi:hypothetical protein